MDKVANLPAAQRRELFQEAGSHRGIDKAVIEKDFWVCWVLKRLFADSELKSRMVFKGGTSLSKVFGLIDRFSEDVDLILDWTLLGYSREEPYKDFESKTKQDLFNKKVNAEAADYIAGELLEKLTKLFAVCPGVVASIDSLDRQCVNVDYPATFSESYLRPTVRLEIGPLASWIPSANHVIHPYAAEVFPKIFEDPSSPVVAIAAERTFWEKATILHKEAHRNSKEMMPSRMSRHYYDVHKLATSAEGKAALANLHLLGEVVEFKQRFYPSARARYDLAKPGTFKLIPGPSHLSELEKDYRDMEVMIFGDMPKFELIIETLLTLQDQINQQS
jgi:hypothetical protein